MNKIDYFFIDGTDFNLLSEINDCSRTLNIVWKSSLEGFLLKYNNKALFLSSDKINVPRNHAVEVYLYNENKTELLGSDRINIEFISVKKLY